MEEKWKDIDGYDGFYQISDKGRVRSWKGRNQYSPRQKEPKILKNILNNGYYRVSLHKKGGRDVFNIHRLVGKAFVPNPNNKPYINHIDGNRLNNLPSNLEWCTHAENHKHAAEMGLMESGEDRYNSKLTREDVLEIRELYRRDVMNQYQLSDKYSVSQRLIWNVLHKKAWKHV